MNRCKIYSHAELTYRGDMSVMCFSGCRISTPSVDRGLQLFVVGHHKGAADRPNAPKYQQESHGAAVANVHAAAARAAAPAPPPAAHRGTKGVGKRGPR